MTRSEQNALIIDSVTRELRDLPNVQDVIISKFDAWFKELVSQGSALLSQGQVPSTPADAGGATPPPA